MFTRFPIDAVDPVPFNGVDGDINQNGIFDEADLTAFIAAWNPIERTYGGAQSYKRGDINFDFKADLADVFLFRQLLISAGIPTAGLGTLADIPEPPHCAVLAWLIASKYLWLRGRPLEAA
jgi:hypothetical protein